MQLFGTMTLADVTGNLVVYRNLNAQDRRIPPLRSAWQEMDLPSRRIPRKHELDYARAAAWIIERANEVTHPHGEVEELIFLGDTALADGNAFRNITKIGRWPGWAFVGSGVDEGKAGPTTVQQEPDNVTIAGRWNALAPWVHTILDEGARLDDRTAVVIDMDKTFIGARGRNSKVIDEARLAGLRTTMRELLGSQFNQEAFEDVYFELNQPQYHAFTADNQDYLAYVCLIVSSGVISRAALQECLIDEMGMTFPQFVRWADMRLATANQPVLADIHYSFYKLMESDDPTPFKTFRRREYLATLARMNSVADDAPPAEHLASEICITNEVVEISRWLQQRGAVIVVLSDKPDEASLPEPDQERAGYVPLHHATTHVVGESIAADLPA